ncbi:MAG: DNA-binding LytR/AlgR family response regulator [Arcticibacterium sp.]|jgi:DNA-binding LytR/AlgR family response regulator
MKTSTITANTIIFDYGKKKVPFASITHFKSEFGNYTKVFLNEEKNFLTAFTLKHYAEKLEHTDTFFIPRKGVIVNKRHVREVLNQNTEVFIILSSGEKIKVSRRRKYEVLRSFA